VEGSRYRNPLRDIVPGVDVISTSVTIRRVVLTVKKPLALPPSLKVTFCRCQVTNVACAVALLSNSESAHAINNIPRAGRFIDFS
jgi:hypothetical protein